MSSAAGAGGKRGAVMRGSAILMLGTVVGHGIIVAASPVLTRMYDPSSLGVLATFLAILAVASVLVNLRYEAAIPLEHDAENANAAVRLCLMLTVAFTVVAFAATLAAGPWLGRDNPHVTPLALAAWTALGVLMLGTMQAGNGLRLQQHEFGLVATARALQGIGSVVVQVAAGAVSASAAALLGGHVVGLALAGAALFRGWPGLRIGRKTSSVSVKEIALRHKDFPLFMSPASLLAIVSQHAPVLVLGWISSLQIVGLYALTYRVLTGPALLFGHAVGQSFYAHAARLHSPDERAQLVGAVAAAMVAFGMPLFVWLALVGPELFGLVFGQPWAPAGEFARYMAPWLALNLVSSTISQYVLVVNRQSTAFRFAAYESVLRAVVLGIGAMSRSPVVLIALFSAAGALISAVYVLWVFRLARVNLLGWLRGTRISWVLAGVAIAMWPLRTMVADTEWVLGTTLFCGLWCIVQVRRTTAVDTLRAALRT